MHDVCVTSKLEDPTGSILTKFMSNHNYLSAAVNAFKTFQRIDQTDGGTSCSKWNFILCILIQIVE